MRTKLYIPPVRPNLVPRPRLIQRLDAGLRLGHRLTLVSAPAGFGKTTLLSEWVAGAERPVAWLSLDEGDNDPARFLAYLVAALQTVEAGIGEGVLVALQSPGVAGATTAPPLESLLTTLINDITATSQPFVLILDDYHLIGAQPIHEALTFLLANLPPQMHLVIAGHPSSGAGLGEGLARPCHVAVPALSLTWPAYRWYRAGSIKRPIPIVRHWNWRLGGVGSHCRLRPRRIQG